jgi:hypothetical protein
LSEGRPARERRATARHADARAGGRARWLILFAALLAFSWQSVVAAAHVHFESDVAATGKRVMQDADKLPARPGAPADSPANCPICRGLAHSHDFLAPAPVVFDAPEPVLHPGQVSASIASAPARRSHIWRSRAPPLHLQA